MAMALAVWNDMEVKEEILQHHLITSHFPYLLSVTHSLVQHLLPVGRSGWGWGS